MSTHRSRTSSGAVWISSLVVLATLAGGARAMTISPSPSYTGNYTVSFSWTGCYESSTFPYRACYFLEQWTGTGAWATVPTAQGATSWTATGKAPGTYTYQVYLTYGYGDKQVVDGPASVTVGTPPPRDPLVTQMNYRFQAKQGDINADGRKDLFIERNSGGVARNGVLDSVILRQNASGGTFSAAAPTAYEASLAAKWPLSSASAVVADFNVDGFVDVEIKGVAAAIGVAGARDQIVFSSGVPLQSSPLGLRAVDASLTKFAGNMLDYFVNPNYFSENAGIAYFSLVVPVYWCDYYRLVSGSTLDSYYSSSLPCWARYRYIEGYYPDYSEFSPEAVSAWVDEQAFYAGRKTRNAALTEIKAAVERVLGVVVGSWDVKELTGPGGPYSDLDHERGLDLFLAILGIANANAQEIVTEEAPRPIPRQPDVIYVVGRYIFASEERGIHSSLQYTLPGSTAPTWVSAFDSLAESGADDGILIAETNDPRDHPLLTRLTLGWVIPPGNGPRATYWINQLVPAHNYYRQLPLEQKARYDAIPEFPCLGFCAAYNSNSYVEGLVAATGGEIKPMAPFLEDFDDLVGGGSPVPASYFGR